MAVPYTFGSATTSIPLSQLDSNFATTITLGNTAIQLGNTVTTLNNMTLPNATIASGNISASILTSGTVPSARQPTGSVLQVVNGTRTGASVSTTSGTDVSFGATASITPTSSSSKIYVVASGGWYLAVGTASEYAISIQRNGATIPTAGNDGLTCVYGTGPLVGSSYVITILDTPATTSSTTYLVVAHNINSGTSAMANGVRASQLNEITLMEIAA